MSGPGPDAALARCVGDVEAFAAEHWDRRPLLRPGADAGAFADLLTLDAVDAIVSSSLRRPGFRMVAAGNGVAAERYTTTVRIGGEAAAGTADPIRVWSELDAGATLVLQALHRSWPPVASFCRELELALTHPVQANAYVTPPQARGLGVHHDTHDVLVLQLAGTKRWQIFEPVVARPLPSQKWNADEACTPLHLEATLRPGDALYLPRGYPHVAWTEEGLSAHLTVGILDLTGLDLLRALVRAAEDDEELRRALPIGFVADAADGADGWARDVLQHALARMTALASCPQDAVDAVARRFWSSLHAVVPGQLAQLAMARELEDTTIVRRRRCAVWWARTQGDELVVVIGERTLHMPAALEKVVGTLLDGDCHALCELDALIDESSRLVLARRLVHEGVLEVVD